MNETMFSEVGTFILSCILVYQVNRFEISQRIEEGVVASAIYLYVQVMKNIIGQLFPIL
jgi:hypothetical protein